LHDLGTAQPFSWAVVYVFRPVSSSPQQSADAAAALVVLAQEEPYAAAG
jgi:hypothetical protein